MIRNVTVLTQMVLVIAADIAGFVLFQHPFRVAETWLAGQLAGLIAPGRIEVVQGTSILVTPAHQARFFVVVTSSCSSISSVCSIACLASLLHGVPGSRRTVAVLAAIGAVFAGNLLRIAGSLAVGLVSGRIALVLFHNWVGSTFAFAYTLGGFILLLYLVLPKRREPVPVTAPMRQVARVD